MRNDIILQEETQKRLKYLDELDGGEIDEKYRKLVLNSLKIEEQNTEDILKRVLKAVELDEGVF